MNPQSTSSSTSYNVDIEAQAQSNIRALESRRSISYNDSSENTKERSPGASVDESGDQDMTETPRSAHRVNISSPHETIPPTDAPMQSEWKPLKPDEPLLTKVPKSETTMEDWVKVMEASDDGMCKGWREQIDNLIIFAGLFSATVTAFTVESYQWLEETPADTLARLQLRDLLNTTGDPARDRLAPATFSVSSASVAINALWFSSLTLSLAAVVFGILCRQWLYEYQRYDNFTTEEAFRIHGLRHRGLKAWRVPEIIASLPILLQMALVLFLIGILVLLWPLQVIVVSIITVLVGLTFLFLGITTVLPSIQYIFPLFDTQCAYKSSQSWSFFIISAFWLFDFGEFTAWASFDQWEVTRVHNGTGSTLSRVYKLLSNNIDAVLGIYSFLADTSLRPTINADLTLLPDFIDQLDASQNLGVVSSPTDFSYKSSNKLRRVDQIKDCIRSFRQTYSSEQRLKPRLEIYYWHSLHSTSPIKNDIDRTYYSRMHSLLSNFLDSYDHISHPPLFNRFVEHWARAIDVLQADGTVQLPLAIYSADIQYDPAIIAYLVKIHGHLMKTGQFDALCASFLITKAYPSLMESHRQHNFNPPPITLLEDVQEWINGIPESQLDTKATTAEFILSVMAEEDFLGRFSESHKSELEKQYLLSFARFFVTFYEREDISAIRHYDPKRRELTLAFLRACLNQND